MWINKDGFLYDGDCQPGDRKATEAEIRAATPNPALTGISALEADITNRRLREATLTDDGKAWLAKQDAAIEELRQKL